MNDVARNVIEKISSYNLFNNFFSRNNLLLYGERVYEVFSSGWRAFRKFVYILFCRNDNKPHRFDVCRKNLKNNFAV